MRGVTLVTGVTVETVPYLGESEIRMHIAEPVKMVYDRNADIRNAVITELKCPIERFQEGDREWLIAHSPEIDDYVIKPLTVLKNERDQARAINSSLTADVTQMGQMIKGLEGSFWKRLKFLFTGNYMGE
jgi:hypothetical protein